MNRIPACSLLFKPGLLAAALAISLLHPPTPTAAPNQKVRLGTLVPRGSSYYNEMREMGQEWKRATGGAVDLLIYPSGSVGGEAQMVRAMRFGQLQAGLLTAVGLAEIEPAVSGLQNVPLLFESLEEVDHVGSKLQPLLEERLEKRGFKVLFWANAGWVRFFTKSPIETPEDLRELKLFSWAGSPEVVDLYRQAGFRTVPLETKEIITGLQTGLISAVPMPPFVANATQVDTRAPHMLDLNWAPLVGAAVVTLRSWNRLEEADRTALSKIARATGAEIQRIGRTEAVNSISAMKNRGLQVHAVSPAAMTEWKLAVEKAYPQIRGKIVPEEIFDQVRNWLEEYRMP